MRRSWRSLLLAAFFAAIAVPSAWALTPDDAIDLSQQGAADETIIAKICADGDAWDLSADDIAYLREQGVSEDVIDALIDPERAAEEFGFTLGDGNADEDYGPRTAYVYSLGYYYGPLSRYYFCDPFFYSYYSCSDFAFSYSYWPTYYSTYCHPYYYGFYPYPYFVYPSTSFYYGFSYCGPSYTAFYHSRIRGGGHRFGNVRYRDWDGNGQVSYRSGKPDEPRYRSRNGEGGRIDRGAGLRQPVGWERRNGGQVRARERDDNGLGLRVPGRERVGLRDSDPALRRGWRSRDDGNGRVARDEMRLRRPGDSYERRADRLPGWNGEGRRADRRTDSGRIEGGRDWMPRGRSVAEPSWRRGDVGENRGRGDAWDRPVRRFDPDNGRVIRGGRPRELRGDPGGGRGQKVDRGERVERPQKQIERGDGGGGHGEASRGGWGNSGREQGGGRKGR